MDPVATELAKESISCAVEAAKEFLSKLVGPAAEEIGFLLQDQVKLYRFKNKLKILAKAEAMLLKAGRTPNAVPFRTLRPILDAAGSEDDESLSTKWAALLANAAAKTEDYASHPSFPHILSEIAPIEARFLDSLLSKGGETDWNSFRKELVKTLEVTEGDINQYYGNLFRLGLVRISEKKGGPKGVVQVGVGPFGKAFLSACTPPEREDT